LPPRNNGPGSPENSSDGGSVVGQPQAHGGNMPAPGTTAGQPGQVMGLMQELDWVSFTPEYRLLVSMRDMGLMTAVTG
jgi:hypothetical protein